MPDRSKLQSGDVIHLLAVPTADVEQRQREVQRGIPDAGWTADTIERIIAQRPIVTIDRLDEYGIAWFEVEVVGPSGDREEHSLAVMDDDSWEYAARRIRAGVV